MNEDNEKLYEYLGDYEKGFLQGMKCSTKNVENAKLEFECSENDTTLDKIKAEIAEEIIAYLKERFEDVYDEYLEAFIENGDYSIDENGEVVKDNE